MKKFIFYIFMMTGITSCTSCVSILTEPAKPGIQREFFDGNLVIGNGYGPENIYVALNANISDIHIYTEDTGYGVVIRKVHDKSGHLGRFWDTLVTAGIPTGGSDRLCAVVFMKTAYHSIIDDFGSIISKNVNIYGDPDDNGYDDSTGSRWFAWTDGRTTMTVTYSITDLDAMVVPASFHTADNMRFKHMIVVSFLDETLNVKK